MRNREEASQKRPLRAINRRQRFSLPGRRETFHGTLAFISLPVSYMVSITLSRQTRGSAGTAQRHTCSVSLLSLPQWRYARCTAPVPARRPGHTSDRGCAPWRFPPRCIPALGLRLTVLPDQLPPLSTPRRLHPWQPTSGTRNRGVHLIKRTNGAGYQQVTSQ